MRNTSPSVTVRKRDLHSRTIFYTFTSLTRERVRYLHSKLVDPKSLMIKFKSKHSERMVLYEHRYGLPPTRTPDSKVLNKINEANYSPLIKQRLHPVETKMLLFCMAVNHMRQKHPNSKTIEDSSIKHVAIAASAPSEVRKYLTEMTLKNEIPERQSRVYSYIRNALHDSLGPKSSADPVFAALIERIARTGAFLDLIEEVILGGRLASADALAKPFMPDKNSPYCQIQKEHRECLETFVNLRYAEEKKKSNSVIERLRETVWKEENES